MKHLRPTLTLIVLALVAIACGAGTESTVAAPDRDPGAVSSVASGGIRVVDVDQAATIHRDRPADLVVLDVRTPEEFAAGHLDGAIMIDFYRDDFADEIAALDRDVPYLLYCRSGSRSSQARALMADLGFADVADIDGGILAWTEAGLPVVTS